MVQRLIGTKSLGFHGVPLSGTARSIHMSIASAGVTISFSHGVVRTQILNGSLGLGGSPTATGKKAG